MLKKGLFGGAIVIIGIVAGFIFLLRGCLSKYDERSAIAPVLYFEKQNKGVVFSIIRYGKAVSYKSGGGITTKSLNTNYYIQANDAETGEVVAVKKIMHQSDIKFHPVTVMGTGNGKAWVFMNELMAFDPFTLEKKADKEMIEAKNPALKGKMPNEKTYYNYNYDEDVILITATDGVKYSLSTTSLAATAIDEEGIAKSPVEAKIKALKKTEDALQEKYRAGYERYRAYNKLYAEKKISYAAYLDSGKNFSKMQDSISKMKSMIRDELSDLENSDRAVKDREREIEGLRRSGSKSYSNICTGIDTFNGRWFGLLSAADLEKPETRFRYRPVYTETARNKLYGASVRLEDSTKKASELLAGDPEKINDAVYLQGGFLLDKKDALPIHLKNDDGFLVCYREKVGNTGNIILSRVDLKGNMKWAFNTELTEFTDWIYTGKRLIILGKDNKEISSGDVNLLISIDIQNGKASLHDYFTDKMRKE